MVQVYLGYFFHLDIGGLLCISCINASDFVSRSRRKRGNHATVVVDLTESDDGECVMVSVQVINFIFL